ncbi:MAG TPA: proteasome subunit beta, partial [Nitrospiraceae bacterium]
MKLPFLPNHDDASFFDFLTRHHPDLTPAGRNWTASTPAPVESPRAQAPMTVPQATTVLAIRYQEGVVIAGDRRATEGYQIAERRIEKVFKIDEYSAMAIAGAAGPCIEMA